MPLQGDGYEIYGVSVFNTGPIGKGVHLPFSRPLTALYGLNGAGKSRVLEGIACAFTGVRPRQDRQGVIPAAHLHVRLIEGAQSLLGEALTTAVREGLAVRRGEFLAKALRSSRDLSVLEPSVVAPELFGEADLENVLTERLMLDVGADGPSIDEGLLVEGMASSRSFTLMAAGTAESPAWQVAPALPLESAEYRRAIKDWAHFQTLSRKLMNRYKAAPQEHDPKAIINEIFEHLPSVIRLVDEGTLRPYIDSTGGVVGRLPNWLALPLRPLGQTSTQLVELIDASRPVADLDADTADLIGRRACNPLDRMSGLRAAAEEVTEQANRLLRLVLPGGTSQLAYELYGPDDWMLDRRPSWTASLRGAPEAHPLTALSAAQQRWAGLAVRLTLGGQGGRPVIFLCDEPELGLHRLAEQRLARGLAGAMADRGATAIVATHSPYLLNLSVAAPVLVDRDADGQTYASSLPLRMLDGLEAEHSQDLLGLTPGALLDLMGVALLVEGYHDQMLFNSVLASELSQSLTGMFPMRGAKSIRSLAEANLLLMGTNAPILLVLDNIQPQVTDVWERVRRFAEDGENELAVAAIESIRDAGQGELRWLKELGRAAMGTGRLGRIHLFGLSQVDAVCYLPAELLLKRGRSWAAAQEAYAAAMQGWQDKEPRPGPKDWWVQNRWASTFNDRAVEDAIKVLRKRTLKGEPLHPDLTNLGARLLALSKQS